jgi:hypothetical protein
MAVWKRLLQGHFEIARVYEDNRKEESHQEQQSEIGRKQRERINKGRTTLLTLNKMEIY